MGIASFESEIEALRLWHSKYKPIFFMPAGDEEWESTWELLARLQVPADQVWINFDDSEGSCFLTDSENAPSQDDANYVALYVTNVKSQETKSMLLLTDQDIECESCSGDESDCPTCGGSGIEWLELDDSSQVSRDPSILVQHFTAN